MCPRYMCILLYVKLMWCSGIPYISDLLEEEALSICAFCYMSNVYQCSGIPQIYGQLEERGGQN